MKRTRCSACGEHGRGAAEKFGVERSRPACLRHIFESVRCAGWICCRLEGDAAIPALLRASVCLLVRAAAGSGCGDSKSAGDRNAASRSCGRDFGKTPITFTRNCEGSASIPEHRQPTSCRLVIGDRERMYRLGHELRRRGLWVAPVDYPAVPQNEICFRACVTAKHTRADLDEALNILDDTLVPRLRKSRHAEFAAKCPSGGEDEFSMPTEILAFARRSDLQSARGRGSSRSVFLQTDRVSVGRLFRATQDDAGGGESAGGHLRRHCRTSLFLS